MPENQNIETIVYSSLFRHGVDEKRRVSIPAKWRPSQPEIELTLILWPNGSQPDWNILVLPPVVMKGLMDKITPMSSADPKASALRRLIGAKSASVTVDKAGRICIPEPMAEAAGIKTDAVLVGLLDRFEIWNPERYDAVSAVDAALLTEAFKLI